MSPTSGGGDSVGWWSAVVGIGTAALATFAGMVRIGQSIEQIETKAKAAKELSDKNASDIQELQLAAMRIEALETAVKQILALFTDEHGNQRIMTTYVCERKAESCNLVITERMRHMGEMFGSRITEITGKIDDLEKRFIAKQDETLKAIIAELKTKK